MSGIWRYTYHLFQAKGKLLFTILLGVVGFISLISLWNVSSEEGQYKVVFDAGSTGTRVHVFRFNVPVFRDSSVVLLSIPLFAHVSGGLSSFASDPTQARHGLKELLTKAENVIPSSEWQATEVMLMATAGLRLLPVQEAENLLREARKVLNESKFKVSIVDTIDGKLEAKYIYEMASFVYNDESMAIVDLGGGSVQLAYQTESSSKIFDAFLDKSSGKLLFLSSWLGYGLVGFRLKVLQQVNTGSAHPCIPEWTPAGASYEYGGVVLPVVASRQEGDHLHACVGVVSDALNVKNTCDLPNFNKHQIDMICGLNGQWLGPTEPSSIIEWKLFSYIYDLALTEGLVKSGSESRLTANDFLRSARQHCEVGGGGSRLEWHKCIDLIYVYVLLSKGFKLDPDYPLMVAKKLRYMSPQGGDFSLEAAWPLGAALSAIKQGL